MKHVPDREGQRIEKRGGSLLERNPVPPFVHSSFVRVPRELKSHEQRCRDIEARNNVQIPILYRRVLDSAASYLPTTRAREPEARRAQRTEADGDQEGDAIAPGQVVHDTAEPRRDTTADAVAHAQDAVDGAEAPPREELGRHRGDDGATGTAAEAEEERIGVEGRRVRPHLESKQAER